jgi:hypothetical protein
VAARNFASIFIREIKFFAPVARICLITCPAAAASGCRLQRGPDAMDVFTRHVLEPAGVDVEGAAPVSQRITAVVLDGSSIFREQAAHLTQRDLARRWRMSERTLEAWRWRKQGPTYLRIGGKVTYRIGDVLAYEAAHLRRAT